MDFCASWREAGNCQNPRQIRRDVDEQPFHRVPLHPAFKVDVECQRRHSEQCRQGCGTQEVACATPRPAERQGDATHSPHAVGRWERRRAAESGGSHTQKFTDPLRWPNLSWLKEAKPVQFQSSQSQSQSRSPTTVYESTKDAQRALPLSLCFHFRHFHHFHHFTSSTRSEPTSRPAARPRPTLALSPIDPSRPSHQHHL